MTEKITTDSMDVRQYPLYNELKRIMESGMNKEEALYEVFTLLNKETCRVVREIVDSDKYGYIRSLNYQKICESKITNSVYFIKNNCTGKIKIGKTKNLYKRLKQFRGCAAQLGEEPHELNCIAVIYAPYEKDYSRIEKEIHRDFRERRGIGEWFDIKESEVFRYLRKKYLGSFTINNIPIYVSYPDILELPLDIIEYDDDKYAKYCIFIATHDILPKYSIKLSIERAMTIYAEYHNKRLDDITKEILTPILSKINC